MDGFCWLGASVRYLTDFLLADHFIITIASFSAEPPTTLTQVSQLVTKHHISPIWIMEGKKYKRKVIEQTNNSFQWQWNRIDYGFLKDRLILSWCSTTSATQTDGNCLVLSIWGHLTHLFLTNYIFFFTLTTYFSMTIPISYTIQCYHEGNTKC